MSAAVLLRCSRCGHEILDGAVHPTIGAKPEVCCERCAAAPDPKRGSWDANGCPVFEEWELPIG